MKVLSPQVLSFYVRAFRDHLNYRCKILERSEADSLWRRANARNVSFQSLYGGQFTLSTQLINPKFCVSRPHRRSTTVSLETNPLVSLEMFGRNKVRSCYIFLARDDFRWDGQHFARRVVSTRVRSTRSADISTLSEAAQHISLSLSRTDFRFVG